MITQDQLRRFERGVSLLSASPAQKLLRMPLRLAWTKLLERMALGRARRVVTRTFWDAPMTVVFPEKVSVSIARYGFFEEGLTRIVTACLKPGMVFFDVGSHFGYFSLLAVRLVGPAGQVHAMEPTPSTFDIVRQNLSAYPNATAHNLAAFAEEGSLALTDYGLEYSAYNTVGSGKLSAAATSRLSPSKHTVRATSLDRFVEETGARPDFVKIDAEGAELDILRGMGVTLAEVRPFISLEVGDANSDAPSSSRKSLEFLVEQGYRPMEVREGRIVPHALRERYAYDNILFVPPGREI